MKAREFEYAAKRRRLHTMRIATTVIQMLIRVLGLVMIVLGLLFWTGNALNFIGLHMMIGIIVVVLLWALAIIAALSRVELRLVALGIVWGIIVVALGMTQSRLLPGDFHWVIKALHL